MVCGRWNCRAHGGQGTVTTNMQLSHRVYAGRKFIGKGGSERGEKETETERDQTETCLLRETAEGSSG